MTFLTHCWNGSTVPSDYYHTSVEQGREYHRKLKGWGGNDAKKYAQWIGDLVAHYGARTMLDYGCGRGNQYTTAVAWPTQEVDKFTEPMTFDQRIGVDSYCLFDPCVTEFAQEPEPNAKFDCVLCTQVLGSIPDQDMSWVIDKLMSHTTKFCFIALIDPADHAGKSCKKQLYNQEHFQEQRSQQWYKNKCSGWEGSDLYLFFKGQPWQPNWFHNQAFRRDR